MLAAWHASDPFQKKPHLLLALFFSTSCYLMTEAFWIIFNDSSLYCFKPPLPCPILLHPCPAVHQSPPRTAGHPRKSLFCVGAAYPGWLPPKTLPGRLWAPQDPGTHPTCLDPFPTVISDLELQHPSQWSSRRKLTIVVHFAITCSNSSWWNYFSDMWA